MIRLLQPGEEEGCGVSIWNRHVRVQCPFGFTALFTLMLFS